MAAPARCARENPALGAVISGTIHMAAPFEQTLRALELDDGRPARVALAVTGACLLLWLGWFVLGRVTLYEVSSRARLEAAVTARDISPQGAGRLTASSLQIGRKVQAGEVVAELDATQEILELQEASARLQSLPAQIAAMNARIGAQAGAISADVGSSAAAIRSARAREEEAKVAADYAAEKDRRMRALGATGAIADIEAMRYATDARRARSARDALAADADKLQYEASLSRRQGEARVDELRQTLAALDAELVAARAASARLQAEIEAKRIRAPADGVIGQVQPVAAGAYVTAGQKLATIVPSGRLLIVAEFPTAHALGRLRPGQTARLRLDGYPWAQYGVVEARVARVAQEGRDGTLRADLEALPSAQVRAPLRHGMTGAAEVAVETASPAELVLRAAGQWLAPPTAGARRG